MGILIVDGIVFVIVFLWVFLFFVSILVLILVCVNLIGDGLCDVLDLVSRFLCCGV